MNIDDIIPYERNARHNEKAVPVVAESIKAFGFKGAIVLRSREDPTIVNGHVRVAACKSLGWTEFPDEYIVYADDLDDDQVKALRLADNRTGEVATWNKALLKGEVRALDRAGLDMSRFKFDFKSKQLPYGAERLKTDQHMNLDLVSAADCAGKHGMPTMPAVDAKPSALMPFNYCKTAKEGDFPKTVHFCIDDYQFERVWNRPKEYLGLLRRFEAVVAPDFSLYLDMPKPMKMWNVYRSRALANWWTRQGLTVIPNLTWADKDSYAYCFEGIPKHSTVFVSTVGVHARESLPYFMDGMEAAIRICKPDRILLYGGDVGIDPKGAEVVEYKANTAFGK